MSILAIFALIGSTATPPFDLANHTVVATFHAQGDQVYECKAGSAGLTWTYREPIAALFEDGKTVGRHFAGPRWELDDGSLIKAKVAQSLPAPNPADIAWLKVDVVQNSGAGRLAQVITAYRLNTHAGMLTGVCATPGELRLAPYSADYVFAR